MSEQSLQHMMYIVMNYNLYFCSQGQLILLLVISSVPK